MWQYLATEQHCCILLKSNFKGHNPSRQVMTPSASLLWWQLRCFLEHRIRSGLFIYSQSLHCGWWESSRGGRRVTEKGDTDGDSVSERGYAWNGVRRLCFRQICLLKLQMHFLFTCPRMPCCLIVFPFLLVCFSHNSPVLNVMTLLSMYLYLNIPCRSQILSLRSNSVHFGARSLFDSCFVTDSGAASTLMRSHRM